MVFAAQYRSQIIEQVFLDQIGRQRAFRPRADIEIDAPIAQSRLERREEALDEIQSHIRVPSVKWPHHVRQQSDMRCNRQARDDASARAAMQLFGLLMCAANLADYSLRPLHKGVADRCQHHTDRMPLEQRRTKFALELAYAARQRRLGEL